jgi:hypothetical protein
MAESFVHLHLHTEYSMLDGASRIGEVVAAAAADGQPAVGITDHGNMYGALAMYEAANAAGIKPVIGMEGYFTNTSRFDRPKRAEHEIFHLTMLAETNEGYRNLIKVTSSAYLDGYYYKPRSDWELLERHHAGITATTGCLGGLVSQLILQGEEQAALEAAARFQDIFGKEHFFVELQDHGIEDDAARLVFVEAKIEQVAQESAALRDSEDIGPVEQAGTRIASFAPAEAQKGGRIAHRREAETHHRRVLGAVVALVDLPGLEAAGEGYEGRVGDHRSPVHARESPGAPRHRQLGGSAMGPHGQLVLGIVGLGHGIRNVVAIGEGQRIGMDIGPELAADARGHAGDARHGERHHAVLARDIGLPADPRYRVAVAHEKAVARVLRAVERVVRRRVVEEVDETLVAAVVDVVEERPVALRRIGRLQNVEIRRVLHPPARVARRALQIDDRAIRRKRRIELSVEAPRDAHVRPDLPEALALGKGRLRNDLYPGDRRGRRQRKTDDREDYKQEYQQPWTHVNLLL